ncbi:MAG: hypothetical protein COV99_02175 [Bacteroidetes bacterium CG12_big_fil_rev_8_21_14_0_65_60_17]|nr:MAG: hypothetical protein COV99_02175 [Bacteroidetes bacterium CG12_big_fil_rev_8_21_14_0_65_60_17]
MKILVTGDIHMGRTSSRLGAATRTAGDAFSAKAVWERVVDTAIDQEVGAVCLTGDIIDNKHAFWETTGAFREGVERLAAAGIRTLAVAGNHDWDVFPRLAADLESEWFCMVGRGGAWQRETVLDRDGRPAVHIDGWSFPSRTVTIDPVSTYDMEPDPQVPTLGMVHGDLEVRDSRYAPLSRSRLAGMPVAGWLLGHIHAPLCEAGPPLILYPGSPQALDPGETGPHGAWIIDIANGRVEKPRLVPLSSVVYVAPEYDVSTWTDFLIDAQDALIRTAQSLADDYPMAEVASLRPIFQGRTRLKHVIPDEMADLSSFRDSVNGIEVVIDRAQDRTRPDLDLEGLAERPGAPGELARLVLALDAFTTTNPGADEAPPAIAALLRRARRAAAGVSDIDVSRVPDEELVDTMRETSLDILDRLMS